MTSYRSMLVVREGCLPLISARGITAQMVSYRLYYITVKTPQRSQRTSTQKLCSRRQCQTCCYQQLVAWTARAASGLVKLSLAEQSSLSRMSQIWTGVSVEVWLPPLASQYYFSLHYKYICCWEGAAFHSRNSFAVNPALGGWLIIAVLPWCAWHRCIAYRLDKSQAVWWKKWTILI